MSDLTCAHTAIEYPKEPIISYAKTREDVLLWRALHSVTPGFYVDVGARDPAGSSVTRAFYDRGWRGVNVEPDPLYAAKLRRERSRDVTLEVALGDRPGEAPNETPGEASVRVTTLAAVLDELGDRQIHFLKIAVEGHERQVLAGADFGRFRPWIVLVEASFGAWEPLLLGAGYRFVYFDELNRFYVADEHADLARFFSAPVSVLDPFRDSEVVRLSAAVAALERDRRDLVKHEVPRLGSTTRVCDVQDADGLLRIVEAQACDLVRLRRMLRSPEPMVVQPPEEEISPSGADTTSLADEISQWARSVARADLARTQEAIVDATERSAWQRLGRRLGLAGQPGWQAGRWQTELVRESRTEQPSTARLLSEVERLKGYLDDLRRSRWRRLGHWLGVTERAPWETGSWRDSLLIEPFPERPQPPPSAETRSGAVRPGHDDLVEPIDGRFLEQCRGFATDVILDMGASAGRFAQALRNLGYRGHIVSFEPLSHAHAELVAAAACDPLWDIADRCAVGGSDGWYQGKERCRVVTADSFIERTFSDPTTLFGVRIDIRGCEAEVLAGLERTHDRVKVILCEMSVAPLHAHGQGIGEACRLLAELDYRCVALSPGFEDPRTGELLRVSGVFVKRS